MKIEDVQVGTWISNEDSTEFLLPQKIDISLGTVHGLLICAWRGEFYHAFRLYTQVHDKGILSYPAIRIADSR